MVWAFYLMILSGMGMLAASLRSIAMILKALGKGRLRRRWLGLSGLIVLFLVGYGIFGLLRLGAPITIVDAVVSVILIAGGVFVLVVSELSATTVNDIMRIATLKRDLLRDPLTGVFNRRYLDYKIEEEAVRARRFDLPLSALMVDLDHFKHVNDTYGHPIGDLVLRHVADLIVRQSGAIDTVVRYGGEEFMVIAPKSDLDAADVLGKRILRHLADETVPLPDGTRLAVTASIGAASLLADDSTTELIEKADRALYLAKRNGRNQVCIFDSRRRSQTT